jgi:hypothetical protein
LRSNSSTKSSLAPAQSFLQQLLDPEDGKVPPAHASPRQLARAAAAAQPLRPQTVQAQMVAVVRQQAQLQRLVRIHVQQQQQRRQ